MNIFEEIKSDIISRCNPIFSGVDLSHIVSLENPENPSYGDISTNMAMLLAKKSGELPMDIACKIVPNIIDISYVQHLTIANPGFINFTIKEYKWHEYIIDILKENSGFWDVDIFHGKKINIEYVSANPTGPIHLGHARGAVYGDVLANILQSCGADVTREYYINDAGGQIDILVQSLCAKYFQIVQKNIATTPSGMYSGEYLSDLAKRIFEEYGVSLLEKDDRSLHNFLRPVVVGEMMQIIKSDLVKLGVIHDVFSSEQSLHDNGKVDSAI